MCQKPNLTDDNFSNKWLQTTYKTKAYIIVDLVILISTRILWYKKLKDTVFIGM